MLYEFSSIRSNFHTSDVFTMACILKTSLLLLVTHKFKVVKNLNLSLL